MKYPRGLRPIVELGPRRTGCGDLSGSTQACSTLRRLGERRAGVLNLYDRYSIRTFKIDSLAIPSKQAETNLRRLFDRVLEKDGRQVVFNLDATARPARRLPHVQRSTTAFPRKPLYRLAELLPHYWTLRSLWMLSNTSRRRAPDRFLNKWRNTEKYAGDPFADQLQPSNTSSQPRWPGQPLVCGLLDGERADYRRSAGVGSQIERYKQVQHDFHNSGVVLPVGDEPSRDALDGFQSVGGGRRGYLLFFREQTPIPESFRRDVAA